MKNRFLLTLALLVALGGAVIAHPVYDDTEASVESQIMVLRDRQAGIRKAKAVLEATFSFPESTPDVRLTMQDMQDHLHGSYEFSRRIVRINNRHQASSYAALITFHELGHWLDNRVLAPAFVPGAGEMTMASEANAPELEAWNEAVKATRTYRGLVSLLNSPNTKPESSRENYLLYVMSPAELFARSFCNYMVAKSGDADLKKQMLTYTQSEWPWNGAIYPADFAPVEKAFDELFIKNGWLKQPAK